MLLRLIKDALQVCYENYVTKITRNVTSALLDSARIAYSKYKRYQEEQARQELEEKRKAEVKKGRRQKKNREGRKSYEVDKVLTKSLYYPCMVIMFYYTSSFYS
jgi:hypothetical protein